MRALSQAAKKQAARQFLADEAQREDVYTREDYRREMLRCAKDAKWDFSNRTIEEVARMEDAPEVAKLQEIARCLAGRGIA